jgi:hypothetical protein
MSPPRGGLTHSYSNNGTLAASGRQIIQIMTKAVSACTSRFSPLSVVLALALAPAIDEHGTVTVLAAAVAVLIATAAIPRGPDRLLLNSAVFRVAYRQARERGRHGAFRRQCATWPPDLDRNPPARRPGQDPPPYLAKKAVGTR